MFAPAKPRYFENGPAQRGAVSEKIAFKEILTYADIRQLNEDRRQSPRSVETMAADLAKRVKRAPQFCRFLNFEKLNMMNLYVLQHKILTLSAPAPAAAAAVPEPLKISDKKLAPLGISETGLASASDVPAGLLDLLKEYNESLKAFKEMQTWREASSSSRRIALSDFAYQFGDEKYLDWSESMFDLSPTLNLKSSGSVDGIRQFLMDYLPLRYVNKDAWNEKLASSSMAPGGGLEHAKTFSSRRADFGTPPFVDNLARALVSVLASVFLLVPMIVLSFITSQKARLGVTVAFVVVFAVALGWFSF